MKKILLMIMVVFLLFATIVSPVNAVFAETVEPYTAKAMYLVDFNTGEVLFEKNADDKLPVASIVKLMTILLTIEQIESEKLNISDEIVISENAAGMGGSQVFLEAGGTYKVGDLLKSVIISSANDASVALSEVIAGSEQNFVFMMNERAKQLGLTNTHYANATGLPTTQQFSTARDISILLREVSSHSVYHNYSTIWIDTLMHSNNRETELVNTNKLIRYYEGCDGGKTGSTNEAGYCLAATAKRGDMRLIAVVLGTKSGKLRFAETSRLLNYGFNNFHNKRVVSKEMVIENDIKVISGKTKEIIAMPECDIYLLCNKSGNEGSYEIKYEMVEEIKAPVSIGDVLGKIYVVKNGQIVRECNIVSQTQIEKATYVDNITKAIENWKIVA